MRLSEARRDYYRRLAKKESYSSRAAYKLLQINTKYKILRPGYRVIDLGCAPGGWLEVASKEVGTSGCVVGVDKKPVKSELRNVKVLSMDIFDPAIEAKLLTLIGGKADTVLSDLSPNISGVWEVDHAKQIDLCMRVVEMLHKVLAEGGSMLLKVFDGPGFKDLLNEVKRKFGYVTIVKPPASRSASSELYLVCKNCLA